MAATLPVLSIAWLGLLFSVGIACSACLGNYHGQISWWLGAGDDFLWLKGEEITSRNAEDAFSCLSMTALFFFPCLVGIFLTVRKKEAEQNFVSLPSPQKIHHVMQNKIKSLNQPGKICLQVACK